MSGDASEEAPDPDTTAAVRRFRPGAMVTYAFFAYNSGSQLEVRPTVYRDTVPAYQPAALPFDGAGQPDGFCGSDSHTADQPQTVVDRGCERPGPSPGCRGGRARPAR
jgi:hypothetical protein